MPRRNVSLLIRLFLALFLFLSGLQAQTSGAQLSDEQTTIHYLSGTGKDDMVEWDFYCTDGRNSGKWTKIGVPSCWELQGFGTYNYGHDPLEERADERGLYKHHFHVPKAWKQKEVKIVFQGVMTDAEVKINGRLAGEVHRGAFYEFKYTITDLLKFGEDNLLEVRVSKVSANKTVNYAERQADFWIFGGIFRPVFLEVLPEEHIDWVAIDARASGELYANLYMEAPHAAKIKASLLDLNGDLVQELSPEYLQQTEVKWTIKARARNILTWNPEKPQLYQLALTIEDQRGKALHHIRQRIGFRTVELRDGDGIYVNGQQIKFKGVNRHSFYPTSGRTTSKALSIEHVQMMKDMNMNAVRMSHYPPDAHFLDVCDSLGLFVIDEVCTWHSPHLDTEVGRKIVKETVVRDVNHPSILLWANGNETGWNTELDDDYAIWDIQKREVIHPWNIFRKTNTLHYFRYHGFANDAYSKDKIFFPTEFLHGLYDGGHGAGLEDYWKQMWNMPTSAGGFLWDFADEAAVRTDRDGALDTDGNHAADGIVGPYGEKEGSYFTIKEIWSPIAIEGRYIRDDFSGIFRVENRYHFTNLDECRMFARWMQFEGPDGSRRPGVLYQEEIALPSLEPGMKGSFEIRRPENWQKAHALHLTALDPKGNEVFTWSYPVARPAKLNETLMARNPTGKLHTVEVEGDIRVTASGHDFRFSGETGILQAVQKDGKVIPLANGPVFLQHKDNIDTVIVSSSEEKVEIRTLYEETDKSPEWAQHKEYSADCILWTVWPDGTLDLKVEIKGKRIVEGYKGISFSFPESEVDGMKWLGDGPYRVWRNRMKGTRFQVWQNDYNNTVTGESGFVYPEFKGFFSSLYWAEVRGRNDNGFTVFCHTPHTFLRMLTPQHPTPGPGGDERGRLSPGFPEGDISFVMNIPPIGTKFQDPETMGPQSNPENYFGNDDDPIVIDLTFRF